MRVRREKRARLLEEGVAPYPVSVPRTHTIAEVRSAYPDLEPGTETADVVGVAGRVVFLRNTGKLCFVTLQDGEGNRLQAMLSLADIGEERLAAFKSDIDLGDHLFVHGHMGSSRRGELSVFADAWQLAAKALRPLPVLHKELSEEARVRQRYVDLIARPAARETARQRAGVVRSLRENFHRRGYLEIETPMLQTHAGGATARPFVTHMNAFDMDLFLRIAPELYLKRLVVGGFPKVYEINRNFRNEGISTQHNPEFTMLEFYTAYADARDQMALTEELFASAAEEILGTTELSWGDETISLKAPFRRVTMVDAILEHVEDATAADLRDLHLLRKTAERYGVENVERFGDSRGKLLAEIFGAVAEKRLLQPTYVIDYPAEISPLSKTKPGDPDTADRFELFIGRMEVANGFCELNDPDEQAEKFRAQVAERGKGDDEAMLYDEDYVEALAYGMPPTAGEGVGIDRLAMLFTNSPSIRDVILFPLMRPKSSS